MTRDLQLAKRIRGDRFWFYYNFVSNPSRIYHWDLWVKIQPGFVVT
jgi:hypothetical protein